MEIRTGEGLLRPLLRTGRWHLNSAHVQSDTRRYKIDASWRHKILLNQLIGGQSAGFCTNPGRPSESEWQAERATWQEGQVERKQQLQRLQAIEAMLAQLKPGQGPAQGGVGNLADRLDA